ncbi:TlpA family protein disulfide reductase [Chitinophaga lutea]
MIKGILLPVLMLCALATGCMNTPEVKSIPEFSMLLPDSATHFNSKDIPFGRTTVLIQFDPACRDCQEETEYILANMEKFRHVNFYLVTGNTYEEMMVFHDHLKLDTCANIKIGIDTASVIPRQFKFRGTPLTLVFNKDKMLTAVFEGKTDFKQLIQQVNG